METLQNLPALTVNKIPPNPERHRRRRYAAHRES